MRVLGLTAGLVLAALALAGPASAQVPRPLPPLAPGPPDALFRALQEGTLTEAGYALERARSIFQLRAVRREFGAVERPNPRSATLILRDLALRKSELTGSDRAVAEALLARPDDGDVPVEFTAWHSPHVAGVDCTHPEICIHWAESPGGDGSVPDAPPGEDDGDAGTIPTWVDTVRDTMTEIWTHQIDTLGYRAPQDDSDSPNPGPNASLDVYVADIGDAFVFGYCATDDPDADTPGVFALSAYCVVDNDYDPAQFPSTSTPVELLQVTSAHEFNHASQFAYDAGEDFWLLEGTATNMEETAYPDVNDNVFFLELFSPLVKPGYPLDRGGFFDSEYGAWIFWRFLEETIAGGNPAIIREIWERVDADGPAAPDDYSLRAVDRELAQRGLSFRDVFARFAVSNRLGRYADAALYPSPPRSGLFVFSPRSGDTGWRAWRNDHLATRYVTYAPGRRLGPGAKLRLDFRLPRYGSRATVIIVFSDGRVVVRKLSHNSRGGVSRRFAFGRGVVRRIDVSLTNGSTRTICGTNPFFPPFFSCFGTPRDDDRIFRVRGRVVG